MKKAALVFIILVLSFVLCACSGSGIGATITPTPTLEPTPIPTPTPEPTPEIIVVKNMDYTIILAAGERVGKYSGETIDGIPNGTGRFDSQNSAGIKWWYEGEFVDGVFDGQGSTTWEGGQKQTGIYKNNDLHGEGTIHYGDGSIIKGNFVDGSLDGECEYFTSRGESLYKGAFEDGKFVRSKEEIDLAKNELKEQAEKVAYKEYAKYPADYEGKLLYAYGRVYWINEYENGQIEGAVYLNGRYNDMLYFTYWLPKTEARILENEKVEIWGIFDGLYTYEAVSGQQVTLPAIRPIVMRTK